MAVQVSVTVTLANLANWGHPLKRITGYGSPRVLEDLLEQGIAVSRKRIARLMQAEGLKARVRKRFRSTTMSDHEQPIAANVLDRQFGAVREIRIGNVKVWCGPDRRQLEPSQQVAAPN